METGAKALTGLRNAVVGVFGAALLAGILLPVYTDEVGWRLQERAGFDGVDKLFVELCGPNTIARPPFWMMPARWYSALFNTLFADPFYIRVSGILYAIGWTVLVLLLIRRIADDARVRVALSTLAVGLLSLGTMPLLLVWSRPEQPILLCFTGAMVIASADRQRAEAGTPAWTAWLRSLAILALGLVALSYHLKALFVLPLFLACLFFAARGARTAVPRLAAGTALIGASAWAAHYWIHRFGCPNAPHVHADFVRNNAGAALVNASDWSHILPLIGKALGNISLFEYLGMPAPREEPMSAWLPIHRIDHASSFAWFIVMMFAWAVTLLLSGDCLVADARRAWRERRLDARPVMAAMLVAASLGWSATQGMRNIYEASFVVPMIVLAVVLVLSTWDGNARLAGGIKVVSAGVGLLGMVSVALVAMLYGGSLVRETRERGYLQEQPYSISAFGYPALRRDILALARQCGITDPDTHRALLIDDVTYFPFMRSYMPEHRYGLFSQVAGLNDPMGYLRSIRSEGIVASCRMLPPDVQARSHRRDGICCLAPANF